MPNTDSRTILVIEDESDIAALIAYQLARAGYRVRTASKGRDALKAIESDPPDLIVLDLMLPEMSGIDILRIVRERQETARTPVVIVTAKRGEGDRIEGFELGADDYVVKPFSPKELVLRVRAVLRRASAEPSPARGKVLRTGPLAVDVEAHRVTVDGTEVKLTPKEYELLICLLERRGRTQSRSALLEAVWETTADIETRTVDMHLGRLRAKLGVAGELIETIRGFGYRFRREE